MALVNIPRSREDPNYRYKMPRLQSKIEGRGNGIKTNISNMGDIAKALKRPPMYITKFFGCELGAMAKFEEAEEKAIINGAHNEKDLIFILDKFIEMYVLCVACHLPEIDMSVKKGLLNYKCNACGDQGRLDSTHKAATYMIRNPPDNKDSTLGKKKRSKEERRAEKIKKQQSGQAGDSEDEEDADKPEKSKEKNKEDKKEKDTGEKKDKKKKGVDDKKKKKVKGKEQQSTDEDSLNQSEELNDNTPSSINSNDEKDQKDDEKGSSVLKNRKKKRNVVSASCGEKLLFHEKLKYDSDELVDVVDRLRTFISSNETVSVEDFFRELRVLQVSQDFDSKCRLYVALKALFGDSMSVDDMQSKIAYIRRVVDTSMDCQDVLNAFEYFCFNVSASSLPIFPYIAQKLYGAEIIDSDEILKHYEEENDCPSFNACKKNIQPFLKWLRENESDEESSENEGDLKALSKPVAVRTKSLNNNLNSNSNSNSLPQTPNNHTVQNHADNATTASTTPNTTKGGEYEEDEFHDAIEGDEDDEILAKAKSIDVKNTLNNDSNDTQTNNQNANNNEEDDFDIDDI